MTYFKTALPVAEIKAYLNALKKDIMKEVCMVEIEKKKSIIITISESISASLLNNSGFINIQLTDTDISVIKIVHKISSVWGNEQLFNHPQIA